MKQVAFLLALLSFLPTLIYAQDIETQMQNIIKRLEVAEKALKNPPLTIGGALRVNFSHTDYPLNYTDSIERYGDFDFDMFRLDIKGKSDGLILSAQIRFFQYMYAIRNAWIAYDISKSSQIQCGIVPMPFGNMPYNSNNFFFSANYYLGLEDTHAAGIHWQYRTKELNFDFGFYKNDDMGGIDGYVENRNRSYTYSIVGTDLNATTNKPTTALAEANTFSTRIASKIIDGAKVNMELGISGLYGAIVNTNSRVGKRYAYALHSLINLGSINLKLQAMHYHIDLDNNVKEIAIGAYAWNELIASKTNSYTAHIAYNKVVEWGAVKKLTFYNDYSLLTDKSNALEDTVKNVTGLLISAGKVYTYIDYITAKNMPFVGGSMAGDSKTWSKRFNINMGYYF